MPNFSLNSLLNYLPFHLLAISFLLRTINNSQFILTKNYVYSESEEIYFPYVFEFSVDRYIKKSNFTFDTSSTILWVKRENEENGGNEQEMKSYLTIRNNNLTGYIKEIKDSQEQSILSYLSVTQHENISSYSGVIGLGKTYVDYEIMRRNLEETNENYKENDNYFSNKYNYLGTLNLSPNQRIISFIQNSDKYSGILGIGEYNESDFLYSDAKTCISHNPTDKNSEFFLYLWNCPITTFKVNNYEIPLTERTLYADKIFAVFATSEEFILASKRTGNDILEYFLGEIRENFGEICQKIVINNETLSTNKINKIYMNYKTILCKSFEYNTLHDFKIDLNGEIGIIATSNDLFKRLNKTHLQFKILVNENTMNNNSLTELWFLGDPFVKNYNFLFNFSVPGNCTITLVPSSKFGLYLTVISMISGILALMVFIVIVYKISAEEDSEMKNSEIIENITQINDVNMDEMNEKSEERKDKNSLLVNSNNEM